MSIESEIGRMAAEAADVAAGVGVDLDDEYGEDAIDDVETALARLAAPDLDPPLSEHGRTLTIERLGCYLLEVARRANGGRYEWSDRYEQPLLIIGEPQRRISIITWDRVRSRLAGDEAANIPFFWEGLDAEIARREPGRMVLFV